MTPSKMVKIKKNWLEEIQNPISFGFKLIKIFFVTYTTQEKLDSFFCKVEGKKDYKPTIKRYYKKWKELGFLTSSREIEVANKKNIYHSIKTHWQILNLEPVYRYCKEYRNIKFTKKEKLFLNILLSDETIRLSIIKEFLKEDLIQAILKFYSKYFIIRYINLLRDIRENPEKYQEFNEKAQELNSPKKRLGKLMKEQNCSDKEIKWDILKSFVNRADIKEGRDYYFQSYINQLDYNKKTICSVDKKILKTLDIYP